ncbi:subfamily c member hypothetical protein [Limosa lapponica baueri]|uniref:J domain-containing protein n=1 Tax=Limosa lapponica baueri TaxID=1758121 RepID=A0A2I0T1Y5_LIMLA|nr:subfamily c member hypothetical protein [Limosa lapponica baueri]
MMRNFFPIDCTKHRSVDESEGRLWAESRGFLYFETSAQTGEGINEMFQVRCESGDEVNKAYRKLAVLLHPDKCVAPGSEDAFKAVVNARTALLKNIK